ncbi:MAG: efflux RND transporter permease subunit, partial [bacterium]
RQAGGKKLWIAGAVSHASRTVILASATTVIGFLSLLATALEPTREFGIATSFGVITCAVLSFFFLPAMLTHMRPPTRKQKLNVLEGHIANVMGKISCFILRRRWWILGFFIAIIAGFFISRSGLQYQTFVIDYFPKREEIVQDTNSIYRELKGFDQFNITVTAPEGEKNYFLDGEVLRQIAAFEDRIIEDPDITKIYSFTAYLRHLNYVMTGERKIPESRPLILLLSRYIRALGDEPEFKNMIGSLADEDFSRMDIIVWCYNHETETLSGDISLKRMMKNVRAEMDAGLRAEWDPAMWGVTLKVVSVSDLIKRDQQLTMVLSMLFVFILTTIAFRSLRYGIVSLVPLATGILLNFILMVILGIPMDMTTVMFSIVVIGVGVDNSIHFLLRFREQAKVHPGDIGQILFHTLRIAGRPIIITTSSIIGGLLVLTFASFKPIIYFGLLVALALFTAAVGTLFVLPSILSLSWNWKLKRRRTDRSSSE